MKTKQPAIISILLCFLYVFIFRAVQSVIVSVMTFLDVWSYAEELAESGATFIDWNEIMEKVLEITNSKILDWQNVIVLSGDMIFIAIVLCICKFNTEKLSEKVYFRNFKKSNIPVYIAIGGAVFLVSGYLINIVANLIPQYADKAESYAETVSLASKGGLAVEMISVIIIAPIAEELLIRGLVYSRLKTSFSTLWSIILSAGFFAYLHDNIYQGLYTFFVGLLFAYVLESTKSIFPCIILHMAYNASGYLFNLNSLLGIPEGSETFVFINIATLLFFVALIPVSVIAFKKAVPKVDLKEKSFKEPDIFTFTVPNPDSADFSPAKMYGYRTMNNENTDNGENDMAIDFIVAGLGNVGEKYTSNRHNMGFLALDYIGLRENFATPREKFRALTYEKVIGGKKVLFLKPQTMMNLSGEAIGAAAKFYKLPPEKVLVIYDDINFDAGDIRIREKGSAGGHNGIKSIINHLGSENFPRIKVGVGKKPEDCDLVDFVLSNPPECDMNRIISNMESIYNAAKLIIDGKLPEAQQKYN